MGSPRNPWVIAQHSRRQLDQAVLACGGFKHGQQDVSGQSTEYHTVALRWCIVYLQTDEVNFIQDEISCGFPDKAPSWSAWAVWKARLREQAWFQADMNLVHSDTINCNVVRPL